MKNEQELSVFIVCFSENGKKLLSSFHSPLSTLHSSLSSLHSLCCFGENHPPLSDFVQTAFETSHSGRKTLLIFIGALGICVRSISPFIKKKTVDPAVICIDELGKFVIPVLSGHIGQANEYAQKISEKISAVPVITTATDINKKWAVDSWCVSHGVEIKNPERIKLISSKVLKGEKILSLGVGCKKNTDSKRFEAFILKKLEENNLEINLVKKISSISLKKDEKAILDFAEKYNLEKNFFTSEELNRIEGNFSKSEFVMNHTGVDCVCERSAIAAEPDSFLILRKISENGMTLAISV